MPYGNHSDNMQHHNDHHEWYDRPNGTNTTSTGFRVSAVKRPLSLVRILFVFIAATGFQPTGRSPRFDSECGSSSNTYRHLSCKLSFQYPVRPITFICFTPSISQCLNLFPFVSNLSDGSDLLRWSAGSTWSCGYWSDGAFAHFQVFGMWIMCLPTFHTHFCWVNFIVPQ